MTKLASILGLLLLISPPTFASLSVVVDLDSNYTNGPDEAIVDSNGVLLGRVWIVGGDSLVAFQIALSDTVGGLQWSASPFDIEYVVPVGWNTFPGNIENGQLHLAGADLSGANALVPPCEIARIELEIAEGESCGAFSLIDSASMWLTTTATEQSYSGIESAALCVNAVAAPYPPEFGLDQDKNGFDDPIAEDCLIEKFKPLLVINAEDTPGMKPCPVGVLANDDSGDPHALRAPSIWVKVWDVALNELGTWRSDHPDWDGLRTTDPSWNYGGVENRPYVGALWDMPDDHPPGPYEIRLFFEYSGPDKNCKQDWENTFLGGSASPFYRVAVEEEPWTYTHIYRDNDGTVVIQYWFFYPYNDWLNNHEGDWEHINVRLSSSDCATAEVLELCYYFHHKYMIRDPDEVVWVDGTHPVVWVGGTTSATMSLGTCDEGPWCCNASQDPPEVCDGNYGYSSHGCYAFPAGWPETFSHWFLPNVPDTTYRCGQTIHWSELNHKTIPHDPSALVEAYPQYSWMKTGVPWGNLGDVPTYCGNVNENGDFGQYPPSGPYVSGKGSATGRQWTKFTGGNEFEPYALVTQLPTPIVLEVPAAYPTVAAAANCALPGDTILVGPGTYVERVKLKGGVTLLSTSGAASTIWKIPGDQDEMGQTYAIKVPMGGDGVRIGDEGKGFTFKSETPFEVHDFAVQLGTRGENRFIGNTVETGTVGLVIPPKFRFPPKETSSSYLVASNRFESLVGSEMVHAISVAFDSTSRSVTIGGTLSDANDFIGCGVRTVTVGGDPSICWGINAECNYWNTVLETDIAAQMDGICMIDYTPWADEDHTTEITPLDLRVPTQYSTIQGAIASAVPGARILVDPGEYSGGTISIPDGVELLSTDGAEQTFIVGGQATGCTVQGGVLPTRIGRIGQGFTFQPRSPRQGPPPEVHLWTDPPEAILVSDSGEVHIEGNRFGGFYTQAPIYIPSCATPEGQSVVHIRSNIFDGFSAVKIRSNSGSARRVQMGGSLDDANHCFNNHGGGWSVFASLWGDGDVVVEAPYNYWGAVQEDSVLTKFIVLRDGQPEDPEDYISYIPWTDSTHTETHGETHVGVDDLTEAAVSLKIYSANPIVGRGSISYSLPTETYVDVEIFNVAGQRVAHPVGRVQSAGWHTVDLPRKSLAPGVFFMRISTERESQTKKVVVLR